ncbi:MAG: tRNA 2-thiouridine(34) synthase MnmA [Pirellulales bacterium]
MARVVLAMSGGVDSSVAAHLLLRAGHDVIGVFMRHGHTVETACASASNSEIGAAATASALLPIVTARPDAAASPHKQGCCTAADAEDARRVADRLDIPFYAIDFQDEFTQIIDYFIDEYAAARTPNPCVMCNNWIKFGKLFEYADSVAADYVATGHYAIVAPDDGGRPALYQGVDGTKDQSYVLFGLRPEVLARVLLPVGHYEKSEIRRMAGEIGLRVADKKDSQEICFVTTGHHAEFIRRVRDDLDTAGEFVTTDGKVVGRHDGIEAFTVGQRKGLGIALGEPHFVVRIEADTRRVVLGRREDLARTHLTADRANWLVPPPTAPRRCLAKIRYNTPPSTAIVQALAGDRIDVQFDAGVNGVSPGQAVVCYEGDRVLGGGWIE